MGKVYSYQTLSKIAELALQHDLWVMSDEIWSDIGNDNNKHIRFSTISKNAAMKSFTVYGFSKSFGLAGLRIGAVLCSNKDKMIEFIDSANYATTIEGVSTISQVAATIAINKAQYWLEDFKSHLQNNRNLVYKLINESEALESALLNQHMLFSQRLN